jgi:hypothetical protein
MKQIIFTCPKCGEVWKDPEIILALRILERENRRLTCSKYDCGTELVESSIPIPE